ncbi:unnamed protein product [Coccothraustes coccothraustes]
MRNGRPLRAGPTAGGGAGQERRERPLPEGRGGARAVRDTPGCGGSVAPSLLAIDDSEEGHRSSGASGAMDNASDYGSEDCRFDSCLARICFFPDLSCDGASKGSWFAF